MRKIFLHIAEGIYRLNEKCRNIFNSIFVLGIAYILLYQIVVLRNGVKAILVYVNRWLMSFLNVEINLKDIVHAYSLGEKICIVYIVLYVSYVIIYQIICYMGKYALGKEIKGAENLTGFEQGMFRYLNDKEGNHCYLVMGQWGSGKTFAVNQFFEKYYKFSEKKRYRISCFGLSSRKQLLDEIKTCMENADDSLYSSFVQLIQYIPVIGKIFYGIMQRSYGLGNISRGTIFIFDDFERVTSKEPDQKITNSYYKRDMSLHSTFNGRNSYSEFRAIDKELGRIEQGFASVKQEENHYLIQSYYEKYNAIVGLINELVETYEAKVIIICNAEVLGYKYINDIFRGKLNCITYTKTANYRTFDSILSDAVKNRIFDNKNISNVILEVMEEIKEEFYNDWSDSKDKNLRFVKALLEAFLDTVILFDESSIEDKDFLYSLFYSIYVAHFLNYKRNMEKLDEIPTGGNLFFYLELFHKKGLLPLGFSDWKLDRNLRWIDIRVSGFWIMNMSKPENTKQVYQDFYAYPYMDLENKLVSGPADPNDWTGKDIRLEHLLYIQKYYDGGDDEENHIDFDSLVENVVIDKENADNYAIVEWALGLIKEVNGGAISAGFYHVLWDWLYRKYQISHIEDKSFICQEYNKYVGEIVEL